MRDRVYNVMAADRILDRGKLECCGGGRGLVRINARGHVRPPGDAHEEREGLPVEGSHRALVRRLCVMFVYFDELGCRIIGFVARSICPLRSNPSALRSSYEFARHSFRMLLIK